MICFENVGMRYGIGEEVLSDITFDLKPGSFHFLTGPSGAGKTTLLKLMYLAERPSRGLVTLMGTDVVSAQRNELPALRRKIGVVFQDYRLIDHLTAFDNVAIPLRMIDAPEAEIEQNVGELLAWVGLADRVQVRPPTLSGGEKQRLAIARAVINRPKILLADEPTGNVDFEMAQRLMHLFAELNKVGTTTVIATHDMNLVETMNAPQLRLSAGRLKQFDPQGQLKQPRKSFSELPLPDAVRMANMADADSY